MKVKAQGKIRYSPTNNGKSIRRDGGTTKWWIVIDCNPEVGRYYRDLYRLSTYNVETLNRPTWDAHISVVSNEQPKDLRFWRKYDGKFIEFEYYHQPATNGTYVWLPVFCTDALNLREELGLSRSPYFPLHLTIGNNKDVP